MKSVFKNETLIRDILAMFRYMFLENYENDLLKLLIHLKDDLPYVFGKFNFLLPNHPYKFEFKTEEQIRLEIEETSSPMKKKPLEVSYGVRQPKLFCAVTEKDWNL